jgi:hypothetical protein
MDIHLKIIITCIALWIIIHCLAFPSTYFAEFGTKKTGSYGSFLVLIAFCILVFPSIICGVHWLWTSF